MTTNVATVMELLGAGDDDVLDLTRKLGLA